MFSIKNLLLLGSITRSVLSSPTSRRNEVSCVNLTIPVSISAQNLALPVPTTGPLAYTTVEGSYKIAARFCEPQVKIRDRRRVLQVLVHGITYDRNYWSGDGEPGKGYHGNEYSWIDYASSQGYPTLSIDRICNGLSDHPDPSLICQLGVNVEIMHEIITKARDGHLPDKASREFEDIIYVGHSYGSIIGNALNAKYPRDCDAIVLTGWSGSPFFENANPIFFPNLGPAALASPARYSSLDLGYLLVTSISAFEALFYRTGWFEKALLNLDYASRGTVTSGEGASIQVQYASSAPNFKGPVLVIAGQYDVIFCPGNSTGCGVGWSPSLKASGKSLYPNAKTLDGYSQPVSGHCWNFHFGALAGFAVVHTWLEEHGF